MGLDLRWLAVGLLTVASCGGAVDDGSCAVQDNADGSKTLTCGDAVEVTVEPAAAGTALDLTFDFTGTSLTFPALTTVGAVRVVRAEVDTMSFPALTTVEGRFEMNLTPVRDLSLPALTTLAGGLTLGGNSELTTLAFPSLTTAGSPASEPRTEVMLMGNPMLGSLSFPALTTVNNGLYISDSPLTSLDLSHLATVSGGALAVSQSQLTSLTMPALTSTNTLSVTSTSALVEISFPALTAINGELTLFANTSLASFDLPELTILARLWVKDNPALPECLVVALRDAMLLLGQLDQGIVISGNDSTATCP